jgi:3',5'-cyclic AMP phosphodiesterase CpdA
MKQSLPKTQDSFRIVQLTDLHLMGSDKDEITRNNILRIAQFCRPDLFVLTGDQAMSKDSASRYRELAQAMTTTNVPWTYCFGNHDAEHGVKHEELMASAATSPTLLFDAGNVEGYGNFAIDVEGGFEPLTLYLFDTHNDRMYTIDGKPTWGYDSFLEGQLGWYESQIQVRGGEQRKSLAFYHIPIPQYRRFGTALANRPTGTQNEPISCAPVDTGFLNAVLNHRSTIAMFVGHDHYNDYTFESDGVVFAYGRVSGQYDYGDPTFEKGFRIIDWKKNKLFTEVVLFKNLEKHDIAIR